jgi:hypothetical protein
MAEQDGNRHPIQRRWARQRPALLWADRLTRRVTEVTSWRGAEAGAKLPRSLGRTLREAAVMAHAGTVAACRSLDAARAVAGVAAVDRALCRLAVWLDLAQRFGDLAPEAARPVLDAQIRLRRALAVLAWERKGRSTERPALADVSLTIPATAGGIAPENAPTRPDGGMTLDVNNVLRYGAP